MSYVFYADVFWMNQFLLHTAILLLASEVSEYGNHFRARCLAVSAIGSTCGTAVLLLSHSYYLYLAASLLVLLPLMTLLAFGKSDAGVFRKRYAGCFAAAILLGGLVTALENIAGIAQIPFLSALIAFLLSERWIRSLMRRRQIQQPLYPIILRHGNRELQINGLLDTGNLLRDPCSGRPVHLVNTSKLKCCGITEADFLGLVPYQTLGSSEGLLAIYRADELRIDPFDTLPKTPGNCQAYVCEQNCRIGTTGGFPPDAGMTDIDPGLIAIRPAVVAAAPEEFFCGKEYDMILNSAVLTKEGIANAP